MQERKALLFIMVSRQYGFVVFRAWVGLSFVYPWMQERKALVFIRVLKESIYGFMA